MWAHPLNPPQNSMANCRQKNKSVHKFSSPSNPIQDHELEFEFGSVTPSSPTSPADHLFLNGRLLPHDFPCPPAKPMSITLSRSTSRTSSVSSKDSLMWSRSNSTSSGSSSSCSTSARTSISDASERKILISRAKTSASKKPFEREIYQGKKPVLTPQYGSQRRQFITQTPVLSRKVLHRSKAESTRVLEKDQLKAGKKRVKGKRNGSRGFCWRFFSWFVSACNECHAISPSRRDFGFQGTKYWVAINFLKPGASFSALTFQFSIVLQGVYDMSYICLVALKCKVNIFLLWNTEYALACLPILHISKDQRPL